MNVINKIPGPLLIFMGALSLSFGGLIVKKFEGDDQSITGSDIEFITTDDDPTTIIFFAPAASSIFATIDIVTISPLRNCLSCLA